MEGRKTFKPHYTQFQLDVLNSLPRKILPRTVMDIMYIHQINLSMLESYFEIHNKHTIDKQDVNQYLTVLLTQSLDKVSKTSIGRIDKCAHFLGSEFILIVNSFNCNLDSAKSYVNLRQYGSEVVAINYHAEHLRRSNMSATLPIVEVSYIATKLLTDIILGSSEFPIIGDIGIDDEAQVGWWARLRSKSRKNKIAEIVNMANDGSASAPAIF